MKTSNRSSGLRLISEIHCLSALCWINLKPGQTPKVLSSDGFYPGTKLQNGRCRNPQGRGSSSSRSLLCLTWPLAQHLCLLQGTCAVLDFSPKTVDESSDYLNRKDWFSSSSEKVNFQQDNTFHSKHGYNILDILGTCLTLITFRIDTLKCIGINLVKQSVPSACFFIINLGCTKKSISSSKTICFA